MATRHAHAAAYAADAGVHRANVAEHVHGWSAQPCHLVPRDDRRSPRLPLLSRIGPQEHANPFPSAASVAIHDGPDAHVTDVHVAGRDRVLKLAGTAAGQYDVPASESVVVAWLGDGIPAWTWAPIPGADPGEG